MFYNVKKAINLEKTDQNHTFALNDTSIVYIHTKNLISSYVSTVHRIPYLMISSAWQIFLMCNYEQA